MEEPEVHERNITVDGKTILVNVYDDGVGYWLLEVVDEHGNSTCWDDPFDTIEGAFDAAAKAVQDEGIEAFIGNAG
jgi:uncharacterized protein